MKKVCLTLLVALLVGGLLSVTAFAHGGHGHGQRVQTQPPRYTLCTVEDCSEVGHHQHSDAWYCSQAATQGGYAQCPVLDCAEAGLHQHDGTDYYCHSYGALNNHRQGHGHGRGRH